MLLNKIMPLINKNMQLYNSYIVSIFKVIDDVVDGDNSANTGLAYDKNRRLIYSGVTPYNAVTTGVYIFNEQGVFQGQLPFQSPQGFDYNPINDTFIVWNSANLLTTRDYSGNIIYQQTGFNPFGNNTNPGSVCIDYVNNKLLLTADNASDIVVLIKSGNDWVFDSFLGAVNPQEGITYDENTNTYWYNRNDVIVNVDVSGNELRTIPQVDETINVNEGLAYNPIKETLYVNSDKFFHSGTPNGNRCVELYPDFL